MLHSLVHQKFDAIEYVDVLQAAFVHTEVDLQIAAKDKLQLAASVFASSSEGITITDSQGHIVDVNGAFTRITGYSRNEVLGKNPNILNSGHQTPAFDADMWAQLTNTGYWHGEIWNRRKSGHMYAVMLTISAVRDARGQPKHYVAQFSDITALKEHEKQLDHIAHYDVLTGLPNRVSLVDRLCHGMTQAVRRGQQLAVVFLDLDGFKSVNDTHGHDVGDQLLTMVARQMKQSLRDGDTLARVGGDEFVAILVDLDDSATCEPRLSCLQEAAAKPVDVGGHALQVSASLGVTFYPQLADIDAEQLLRQADQAMYQAKLAGKNRYHLFDSEHDNGLRSQHESIERIRHAMLAGELLLYFQPKVNMRTGHVIGVEALIRWQHPDKGLQAPATFLPLIEGTPLAVDIGEWVLDTALKQMEVWQALGQDMAVSVNVGARQLQQPNFVTRLRETLSRHPNITPCKLELEVLETSALDDIARVSVVMAECRLLGIEFALDDFGTGYSSLTYLKRLPVALLKMDQSFVRDMLIDPDDLAILEGVIGLARAFRRNVIAEGVETIEHGTRLLALGCDLAQGFGIARPMPAQDIPRWVAEWRPDKAWIQALAPFDKGPPPDCRINKLLTLQ